MSPAGNVIPGITQDVATVPVVGADTTGFTDSSPLILAAIAAAQAKGHGAAIVELPAGKLLINQAIEWPGGVSSRGAGGSFGGSAATEIVCGTAAAGFIYDAGGGQHSGYQITGNGVGQLLGSLVVGAAGSVCAVVGGSQCTFTDIEAINGAVDNWHVTNNSQNHKFINCGCQGAANDGLVIDLGAGGLTFSRFESAATGRYCLTIQESAASPGAYVVPSHITFDGTCLFERAGAANGQSINITDGDGILFDHVVVTSNAGNPRTEALAVVQGTVAAHTGIIEFRSCRWFGSGAANQPSAIRGAASATISVTGAHSFNGVANAIDNSANPALTIQAATMQTLGAGIAALVTTPAASNLTMETLNTTELGQAGFHVPHYAMPTAGIVAVANQAYLRRFVPDRNFTMANLALFVTVAATVNDSCDAGVYTPAGVLLASNGGVAGKMNATGVQLIPVAFSFIAGTVYYIAFAYGAVGGVAATILMTNLSNGGSLAQLFGASAGNPGVQEQGFRAASFPLPANMGTITGVANMPMCAIR